MKTEIVLCDKYGQRITNAFINESFMPDIVVWKGSYFVRKYREFFHEVEMPVIALSVEIINSIQEQPV